MNTSISGNVIISGNNVTINGISLPPAPVKGINTTIINDKVFLDGYEFNFKKNKWNKTIRSLWHKYF